jgi:hypothetical protein
MTARDVWSISCRDLTGRRHALTVFVDNGHIILVPPLGDAAILSPLDAGRLRAALRDAVLALARSSSKDDQPG